MSFPGGKRGAAAQGGPGGLGYETSLDGDVPQMASQQVLSKRRILAPKRRNVGGASRGPTLDEQIGNPFGGGSTQPAFLGNGGSSFSQPSQPQQNVFASQNSFGSNTSIATSFGSNGGAAGQANANGGAGLFGNGNSSFSFAAPSSNSNPFAAASSSNAAQSQSNGNTFASSTFAPAGSSSPFNFSAANNTNQQSSQNSLPTFSSTSFAPPKQPGGFGFSKPPEAPAPAPPLTEAKTFQNMFSAELKERDQTDMNTDSGQRRAGSISSINRTGTGPSQTGTGLFGNGPSAPALSGGVAQNDEREQPSAKRLFGGPPISSTGEKQNNLFGQPSSSSTPLFGASQAQTPNRTSSTSLFGAPQGQTPNQASTTPAQSKTASLFGALASQTPQNNNLFGAGFKTPQPPQANPSTPMFGAQQQNPPKTAPAKVDQQPLFGARSTAFGQTQPSSTPSASNNLSQRPSSPQRQPSPERPTTDSPFGAATSQFNFGNRTGNAVATPSKPGSLFGGQPFTPPPAQKVQSPAKPAPAPSSKLFPDQAISTPSLAPQSSQGLESTTPRAKPSSNTTNAPSTSVSIPSTEPTSESPAQTTTTTTTTTTATATATAAKDSSDAPPQAPLPSPYYGETISNPKTPAQVRHRNVLLLTRSYVSAVQSTNNLVDLGTFAAVYMDALQGVLGVNIHVAKKRSLDRDSEDLEIKFTKRRKQSETSTRPAASSSEGQKPKLDLENSEAAKAKSNVTTSKISSNAPSVPPSTPHNAAATGSRTSQLFESVVKSGRSPTKPAAQSQSKEPNAAGLFGAAPKPTETPKTNSLFGNVPSTTAVPTTKNLFGAVSDASASAPPKAAANPVAKTAQPTPSKPQTAAPAIAPPKFDLGGMNFMNAFLKSQDSEEVIGKLRKEAMEKAKLEDWDEDEESEKAWEKRYYEEQRKKQETATGSAGPSIAAPKFTMPSTSSAPLFGSAFPSSKPSNGLFGDAGASTTTTSLFGSTPSAPAPSTGSLFGTPKPAPATASSGLFGNAKTSTPSPGSSIFSQPAKPSPPGANIFGHLTKGPVEEDHDDSEDGDDENEGDTEDDEQTEKKTSTSDKGAGDHTWKKDTPIKFGSQQDSSASADKQVNTPLFGGLASSSTSLFPPRTNGANGTAKTPTAPTNLFGSPMPNPTPSLFGGAGGGSLFGKSASTPSNGGFNFSMNKNNGPASSTSLFAKTLTNGASTTTSNATSREESPASAHDTGAESSADGPSLDGAKPDTQVSLTDLSPEERKEEDILFEFPSAKYHSYDKTKKTWVKGGAGPLRVLRNKTTGLTRILVRQAPSGKVVINSRLFSGVKYENPQAGKVKFMAIAGGGALTTWVATLGKKEPAEQAVKVLEENKPKE